MKTVNLQVTIDYTENITQLDADIAAEQVGFELRHNWARGSFDLGDNEAVKCKVEVMDLVRSE